MVIKSESLSLSSEDRATLRSDPSALIGAFTEMLFLYLLGRGKLSLSLILYPISGMLKKR